MSCRTGSPAAPPSAPRAPAHSTTLKWVIVIQYYAEWVIVIQYYAKEGHCYICLNNNAALEYYSTQWVIINMALNVYFLYVNLYIMFCRCETM